MVINYPTGPAAKQSRNPNKYWNSFSWGELGADAQNLWGMLGWNSGNWDGPESNYPASYQTEWQRLTAGERDTATKLGYDQATWDED